MPGFPHFRDFSNACQGPCTDNQANELWFLFCPTVFECQTKSALTVLACMGFVGSCSSHVLFVDFISLGFFALHPLYPTRLPFQFLGFTLFLLWISYSVVPFSSFWLVVPCDMFATHRSKWCCALYTFSNHTMSKVANFSFINNNLLTQKFFYSWIKSWGFYQTRGLERWLCWLGYIH